MCRARTGGKTTVEKVSGRCEPHDTCRIEHVGKLRGVLIPRSRTSTDANDLSDSTRPWLRRRRTPQRRMEEEFARFD